jgi:hypothetical protein
MGRADMDEAQPQLEVPQEAGRPEDPASDAPPTDGEILDLGQPRTVEREPTQCLESRMHDRGSPIS